MELTNKQKGKNVFHMVEGRAASYYPVPRQMYYNQRNPIVNNQKILTPEKHKSN